MSTKVFKTASWKVMRKNGFQLSRKKFSLKED